MARLSLSQASPKVLLGFVAERESRARVGPSRAVCSPFAPGTLIFQLVVKSGVLAGAHSFLSKCPLWLNENQYLVENYLLFSPLIAVQRVKQRHFQRAPVRTFPATGILVIEH